MGETGLHRPSTVEQGREAGMLCSHLPEEYGGLGADFLYSAVVIEEVAWG
jgi:alkylation response protein AidB-like acyl-CoA dehydrogenase